MVGGNSGTYSISNILNDYFYIKILILKSPNRDTILKNPISDSERSDECIDFTMIITNRNKAPFSNFGGGFRCKSEYPRCIIEVKVIIFQQFSKKKRKTKKVTKKREFLLKTSS
ncbi:Uncharacterized protein FWK35_00024478 [Aphis craccivora]|uniref:Uncharacterized protein n=1 Tax=Aphis craccivora TaxID=307492 RepID=A0A6G0Y2S0_APHCR|nr:Uncharacterized protein FWK35_00024478 [Aphis craccivora]